MLSHIHASKQPIESCHPRLPPITISWSPSLPPNCHCFFLVAITKSRQRTTARCLSLKETLHFSSSPDSVHAHSGFRDTHHTFHRDISTTTNRAYYRLCACLVRSWLYRRTQRYIILLSCRREYMDEELHDFSSYLDAGTISLPCQSKSEME